MNERDSLKKVVQYKPSKSELIRSGYNFAKTDFSGERIKQKPVIQVYENYRGMSGKTVPK